MCKIICYCFCDSLITIINIFIVNIHMVVVCGCFLCSCALLVWCFVIRPKGKYTTTAYVQNAHPISFRFVWSSLYVYGFDPNYSRSDHISWLQQSSVLLYILNNSVLVTYIFCRPVHSFRTWHFTFRHI